MRRFLAPLCTVAMVALAATGCASGPSPVVGPRYDPTVITRDEIQTHQFTTAYDAVKGLRGTWLNVHGTESVRYPMAIQLYIDNVHTGDVSALPTVPTTDIQFIRFYRGQEASARWGVDHGAGVVFISTKVARQGLPAQPPA